MGEHRLVAAGCGLLLLLVLAACAARAPIEPALESAAVPVSFAELAADPDRFLNETVILGGQIIETVPTAEGTRLTVLETRTEGGQRPERPETSEGRFIALTSRFLDPHVYAPGRQVTVAGTVAGKRPEKLGGTQYAYPVINAQQVYLWPLPGPAYGYYYPPSYYPYWGYYWPYEPFYPGPFVVVPREREREKEEEREARPEMRERGPAARPEMRAPAPARPEMGAPHGGKR